MKFKRNKEGGKGRRKGEKKGGRKEGREGDRKDGQMTEGRNHSILAPEEPGKIYKHEIQEKGEGGGGEGNPGPKEGA